MVGKKEFELRKEAVLKALASTEKDKSRKGGIDAPIVDLISCINSHPAFFTISSCSGRISVFLEQLSCVAGLNSNGCNAEKKEEEMIRAKKGGDWIYVSHEPAEVDELVLAVRTKYEETKQEGLLVFRFEPFILALECSSLAAAQKLVTCAQASGYRESGVSSMEKRIIVALRSSIRLEVPIGEEGQLIVPQGYLRYLTLSANKKFSLNQQRIFRFLSTFVQQLHVDHQIGQPLITNSESLEILGSNRVQGRRRGRSLVLQHKLLSNLQERQSKILLKIKYLGADTRKVLGGLGGQASASLGDKFEPRKALRPLAVC